MEFTYNVPNGRDHAPLRLYAVQGEAGARTFTLNLTGGGAVSGTAYVYVLKNDGTLVVIDAGSSTGSVTFTLPRQACTCPKTNKVYIQLIDGQTETRWDNIELWVKPCDLENAVASTDDLGPLADIITDPDYLQSIIDTYESTTDALESVLSQLAPKGEYDPEVAYAPYNIVAYKGMSYIAKKPSTGVLPTDTEHWALLVSNAVPGPQGVPGKKGDRGAGPCRVVVGTTERGWTAEDCDYLCDGIADDVEINAAIAEVVAGKGGEILLLDGPYFLEAPIAFANTGGYYITLIGNGGCTSLRSSMDGYLGGFDKESSLVLIDASGITIRDLACRWDNGGVGIYVSENATQTQVLNVQIEGPGRGVYINQTQTKVSGCKIASNGYGADGTGVYVGPNASSALIQNCNISNAKYGVYSEPNRGNHMITGNYIDGVSTGIWLSGDASHYQELNTISGNMIWGASGDAGSLGIGIANPSACAILANLVHYFNNGIQLDSKSLPSGEWCGQTAVSANTVNNGGNGGIVLWGKKIRGCTISGNQIAVYNVGVYLTGEKHVISGNNVFRGPTGTSSDYSSGGGAINCQANSCLITSNGIFGGSLTLGGSDISYDNNKT